MPRKTTVSHETCCECPVCEHKLYFDSLTHCYKIATGEESHIVCQNCGANVKVEYYAVDVTIELSAWVDDDK